jgi:osmotically inducible protein OsmC
MKRHASAVWHGGIKDGKGSISTQSTVLKEAQYSYGTRFENGVGTNPEELLAAAHAGCFSMALSLVLNQAGLTADQILTTATISLEKSGEGFAITESHLEVEAKVPGATADAFEKAANGAKANCPVSKLYNTNITMNARLV